jgi:hypothetical protein
MTSDILVARGREDGGAKMSRSNYSNGEDGGKIHLYGQKRKKERAKHHGPSYNYGWLHGSWKLKFLSCTTYEHMSYA